MQKIKNRKGLIKSLKKLGYVAYIAGTDRNSLFIRRNFEDQNFLNLRKKLREIYVPSRLSYLDVFQYDFAYWRIYACFYNT